VSDLTNKFDMLRSAPLNSIAEIIERLEATRGEGDGSIVDLLNATNLVGQTLVDIRTLLENLNTTIEVMNNNASTNAQQTISAVISSSCGCDLVTAEPPFEGGSGETDCDAASELMTASSGLPGPFVSVTLPEGVFSFGPPRTANEHDCRWQCYRVSDSALIYDVELDDCPVNGATPAGDYLCRLNNLGTGNFEQPVGWCWSSGPLPAEDTCARAQAVVSGFEAILAGFANMPDSAPLTNTAINLAFAKASPFIASQPPDSLTRQNLINLWTGASGGFHYGLLPSGLSTTVRDALIAAVFNASDAENAGVEFLAVLETQLGIEAPYLDFAKSIPQQFWFNAVFDASRTDLNTAPFDNNACTS
jgi:hypothetical protein